MRIKRIENDDLKRSWSNVALENIKYDRKNQALPETEETKTTIFLSIFNKRLYISST